jgi:23S rRNA pseudouridine955/2504/2580 synthase
MTKNSRPPLQQVALSVQQHLVIPDEAGQRLDNFLLRHFKGVPRSRIYRAIQKGEVRVNKGRVEVSYRLQAGDTVRLPPLRYQPPAVKTLHPNLKSGLEGRILYEDAGLIVVNKPSGIAVHGGSGISLGVIEALRLLHPQEAKRLELVHRLDKETSGCLLVAKKRSVLTALHQALREHRIEKVYFTLVQGHWPQALTEIDVPLEKNHLSSGEWFVRPGQGKAARTGFKVLHYYKNATLLEVQLYSGRTHQIRVHAAHAGHPVAGDDKYGNREFNQMLKGFGLSRLFLHAARLKVPLGEEWQTFEAPLEPGLAGVLERLGEE